MLLVAQKTPAGARSRDFGFQFSAMACSGEIRIEGLSRRQAEPLALMAIAEIQRIELKYSRYREGSTVSRINASAGHGDAVDVDTETARLLDFASDLHALSDGLFDISSGVLRRAWDFRARRMPGRDELESLLPLVGWHRVTWRNQRIALPLPGMEIDFGGFGKEYAADRAATLLQERGLRHGLVNLGGDIRLIGPRADGSPWQLGVQHPRAPGQLLAEIPAAEGALATSGDYERFFEAAGLRYCHILNPHTGWPVDRWQSISVLAPACLPAGALTTIAMLKGDGALPFLRCQGVGFLAVDRAGGVHAQAPASRPA